MSFLVRKIERARWNGSDVAGSQIKADVVASCIKPNGSALSVWYAETQEDVERAKLATLANLNKLATIDLVVLTLGEIEELGLGIIPTKPKGGPASLAPLHRDIHDLDLDSLKTVAQLVQTHIVNATTERLTRATCKRMLEKAIEEQLIEITELDKEIAKYLVPEAA